MSRKVALKIIKPGMATKDVIARFEAERQALALMDHPNLAKVLDAGATTELPVDVGDMPKNGSNCVDVFICEQIRISLPAADPELLTYVLRSFWNRTSECSQT